MGDLSISPVIWSVMSLSQVTVTRRSLIILHIWAHSCEFTKKNKKILVVLFAAFSHFIIQTQWHHMANELQAKADTIKACLMNYSSHIFSLKRRNWAIYQGKYSLLILRTKKKCQKPENTYTHMCTHTHARACTNTNAIRSVITIRHLELKYRFMSHSSATKCLKWPWYQ